MEQPAEVAEELIEASEPVEEEHVEEHMVVHDEPPAPVVPEPVEEPAVKKSGRRKRPQKPRTEAEPAPPAQESVEQSVEHIPEPQPEPVVVEESKLEDKQDKAPMKKVRAWKTLPPINPATTSVFEPPVAKPATVAAPQQIVHEVPKGPRTWANLLFKEKMLSPVHIVPQAKPAPRPAVVAAPKPATAAPVKPSVSAEETSLYVSGLPENANEKDLATLFAAYGALVSAEIPPGKPFGFVTYKSADSVAAVLEVADTEGVYYAGTEISVQKRKGGFRPRATGAPRATAGAPRAATGAPAKSDSQARSRPQGKPSGSQKQKAKTVEEEGFQVVTRKQRTTKESNVDNGNKTSKQPSNKGKSSRNLLAGAL